MHTVESRLRLFAQQNLEFAIMLLDSKRCIDWWGPGAAHIFGYGDDETLGRPVHFLFTSEDVERGVPEYEAEAAELGLSAEDDRWMMRKDGSRFFASGTLHALKTEQGTLIGYCKILRDRSDAKILLETFREQYGHYEKVHLELAHELRNVLNPLTNGMRLMQMRIGDDAQLRYAFDVASRQVTAMSRMVEHAMDVSRSRQGKMFLQSEVLDLVVLVNEVVETMRPSLAARRQTLDMVDVDRPLYVHGDGDRLRQVFSNLLGNSNKYTPAGGHIGLHITVEGEEALIKLEDSGVGIPPELLPRLFRLFSQAEPQRSEGGLGVGLSLVHEIVTLHGGTVQARSEGLGKGAEFIVRLPLAQETSPGE